MMNSPVDPTGKHIFIYTSIFMLLSIVGFETDKKPFSIAQRNLAQATGERKHDIGLDLFNIDFFSAPAFAKENSCRWLIANPPYGERIKVRIPLKNYYEALFAAAERVVQPNFAVTILPAKVVKGKLALPQGWAVKAKRPFSNGGIPVVAFLFARK